MSNFTNCLFLPCSWILLELYKQALVLSLYAVIYMFIKYNVSFFFYIVHIQELFSCRGTKKNILMESPLRKNRSYLFKWADTIFLYGTWVARTLPKHLQFPPQPLTKDTFHPSYIEIELLSLFLSLSFYVEKEVKKYHE